MTHIKIKDLPSEKPEDWEGKVYHIGKIENSTLCLCVECNGPLIAAIPKGYIPKEVEKSFPDEELDHVEIQCPYCKTINAYEPIADTDIFPLKKKIMLRGVLKGSIH